MGRAGVGALAGPIGLKRVTGGFGAMVRRGDMRRGCGKKKSNGEMQTVAGTYFGPIKSHAQHTTHVTKRRLETPRDQSAMCTARGRR